MMLTTDLATPNLQSHLATLATTSSPSLFAMTSLAPEHLAIPAPSHDHDLATPSSNHLAMSTFSSDAALSASENLVAFSTSSCLTKPPSDDLASSHHLASPLASALRSNGSVSAPVSMPDDNASAYYNPGVLGGPFPVVGSFMDLLNGSSFSVPDSTFGNAWNDPFMSGMGANTLHYPAGSMTNNFNGMSFKPTQHLDTFSNFSFSPFNIFGTADYTVNGGSHGPYNFDGIPTYVTMPTPSLQDVQPGSTSQSPTLPAPLSLTSAQSPQLPAVAPSPEESAPQPRQPLANVAVQPAPPPLTSAQSPQLPVVVPLPEEPASRPRQPLANVAVQPAPLLPPTEPGVVNTQETHLVDDNGHTPSSGCSKRKPVPSKSTDRDNHIGKENHIPPPATRSNMKGKKPACELGSDKNMPAKRNRKQAADSEPADDVPSKHK